MLDNETTQLSEFKTKNRVEISDDASGTYSTKSQITFKTTMPKSSLCRDVYTLVKGAAIVVNTAPENADSNNRNKKVIFKNFVPFANGIS